MNHLKRDSLFSSLAALLFATVLVAGGGLDAQAQTIITAKDYSGFMRGSGYGWPTYVPASNLGEIHATQTNGLLILEWSNPGILQKTSNLAGLWVDVTGSSSPYEINLASISGEGLGQKFYRLRGVAGVHSGVGAGCPQQGFDFTGLRRSIGQTTLQPPRNAAGSCRSWPPVSPTCRPAVWTKPLSGWSCGASRFPTTGPGGRAVR